MTGSNMRKFVRWGIIIGFTLFSGCTSPQANEIASQMESCAIIQPPAIIEAARMNAGSQQILFKQDDSVYVIKVLENLYGDKLSILISRIKDNKISGINLSMQDDLSYNVAAVYESEARIKGDADKQIESVILDAMTNDSFVLVENFPDCFELTKDGSQYTWKITDRDKLMDRVEKSGYAKLGVTLPEDFTGTWTVDENNVVTSWHNTDWDGHVNEGEIRSAEDVDTDYWISLFNENIKEGDRLYPLDHLN